MNKGLQNKAWSCFPKEFKKEVKRMYKTCAEAESIGQFIKLFGYDNLTSDAEGEDEMLFVKAKTVREMYALNEDILFSDPSHKGARLLKAKLQDLFGSKCLSDENSSNVEKLEKNDEDYNVDSSEQKAAGPKFKVEDEVVWDKRIIAYVDEILNDGDYIIYSRVGNRYTVHESDLEPYTEQEENPIPSNLTELNSKEADKHFDTILKDSFAKERRLNIATTIIERIIKSEYYSLSEKYREDNIKEMVKVSLQITDAIMAECEKGGGK